MKLNAKDLRTEPVASSFIMIMKNRMFTEMLSPTLNRKVSQWYRTRRILLTCPRAIFGYSTWSKRTWPIRVIRNRCMMLWLVLWVFWATRNIKKHLNNGLKECNSALIIKVIISNIWWNKQLIISSLYLVMLLIMLVWRERHEGSFVLRDKRTVTEERTRTKGEKTKKNNTCGCFFAVATS